MNENGFSEPTDAKYFTLKPDTSVIFGAIEGKRSKSSFFVGFLSLLMVFFFAGEMWAQTTIIFTSNSTWTCPAGVTSITVEAWGGGGRGGTSDGGQGAASGGGGGAYAKKTISVAPGNSYNVTVGLGGNYPATTNGGDSYFNDTTTVKAAGGTGAPGLNAIPGGSGGLIADCVGDVVYKGGNGGNSPSTNSGAGGGGAGSTGDGGNANLYTPGTGTSVGGGNGGYGAGNGNGAFLGVTIGGGGGGAVGNGYAGGDGARGEVRITIELTNGPGGVIPNLQLWLRSDLLDGTTTVANNTDVTIWKTQALGENATKPTSTGAPKYRNNATDNINFNSVVDFTNAYNSPSLISTDNDASRQYLKGAAGFYSQDLFVVLIPDVAVTSTLKSMDIFCGDKNVGITEADGTGIGYGAYTSRMSDEVLTYAVGTTSGIGNGYGVAHQSTTASYNSPGIINTRNNSSINGQELYFNANNVTNSPALSPFANVSNSQYWIGRSEGWTGSLDARVAEVITYSSRTTDTQRSNIRSYLAIKYGITLGVNGTSMNYTNSAGTTIWDIAANAGYNFDIAGIGRDDITKLIQKQSKSVNATTSVAIGLGSLEATNTANRSSFSADRDYLVWGSNGLGYTSSGVLSSKSLKNTSTNFTSIVRKWKIKESQGDVGEVFISIPTTALTSFSKTASEEYVLVVSSTEGFEDANIVDVVPLKIMGSDLQTWYDFDGTKFFTFAKAPLQDSKLQLNIAAGDFLVGEKDINLSSTFTISSWIRNSNTAVVRSFIAKGTEYDLKLNAAHKVEFSWNNAIQIISTTELSDGKWHQVAVTYSGNTAMLYIDGVLDKTVPSIPVPTSPTPTTAARFSIGGVFNSKSSITAPFLGDIDEVRIWDVALSVDQLRYILNQEMEKFTDNTVNGKLIPQNIIKNDIKTIPWLNVKAYYDLNRYYGTVADDKSNSRNFMRIKYLQPSKQIATTQTAPLPYESQATGLWQTSSTWLNNTLQVLPNSMSLVTPSVPVNWNIVKTTHNITSEGDKTVLGLYVGVVTTSTLKATNNSKIEVSHYLKLDGKIDLEGMSQLVQTEGSDLDPTSSGSLERDQQGQANKYNYNYWGSPVGTINSTSNNNNFTVAGVLRDGTNPLAPGVIKWITGYDGTTTPFSLAGYWIYKFDNKANAYANWTQIWETGSLEAGKGFTLKGAGTSGTQNLTFIGKPNNGTITNAIGADQLLLVGNPYSSALDADKFIDDNIGSIEISTTNGAIDGSLYFWEHYSTNNTHNLGGYQGGYGIYNKSGGVKPSAVGVDFISGAGTSSKLKDPQRYISVGQGFFVIGKTGTSGIVTFNNSQRKFFTEVNAASQTMYKKPYHPKGLNHWTNNSNDTIKKDIHKRIRLGYTIYNENIHRQVLLAFMDEKANGEMNYGYDAFNIDDFPNDMYLLNGENELGIEGEGYFDPSASFPIGVRSNASGKVSFVLDSLENFDKNQAIFIYDKSDETYHNIKDDKYEVQLPAGIFNNRFSLRFTDKTLGIEDPVAENGIQVDFIRSASILSIVNSSADNTITTVSLFNILGKSISKWEVSEKEQTHIKIPIHSIASGVYIVKLKTFKGTISKKIIVP
jgi:hypothetical protein